MDPLIDVITVYHNADAYIDSIMLEESLEIFAPDRVNFIGIDNRENNRGFAKACNLGATLGNAPIIGFINPDATIYGPFVDDVMIALANPDVVVTGSNFEKPKEEYKNAWGCEDWACGSAFFVKRNWFEFLGGFDESFVWSWEETDFIRRTQAAGKKVKSIELLIQHQSPTENSEEDSEYKRYHFQRGADLFYRRWGR